MGSSWFLALCLASSSHAFQVVPLARGAVAAGRVSIHAQEGIMPPQLKEQLDSMVQDNKIMLFMKGNKLFPQCGFSNTAVQILNSLNVEYETYDVLADEAVRSGIKQYSNWPTIPQCYIEGEFIGGCDLLIEMYQSGELQEMCERAAAS